MSNSENAKTYADRAQSEPTELHKNFAQWIEEQTGIKPDLKTVQIVCSMRMDFQRSEENQKHLKDRKAAAEAKRKKQAAEKKARLEKQLAELQAELAKETAESMPAEKAAPAKKAVAAKPEDKPATPTRRTRKAPTKAAEAPATPKAPRTRTAKKTAAPVATESK
ncbi:hypothetical protein ACH4MG_34920 [Streptomyces sp. NPDC017454]|uniref:hypothetical protein n=1 Tax=Streptomyces sp. NPDC017454 TaxID=3364997 RepID=UPI0037A2F03D